MRTFAQRYGWPLLMKRWVRVAWDIFVMFIREQIMHHWQRLSFFFIIIIQVEGAKKGGNRSKITLIRTLKNNMSMKEVIENTTLDKIEWWQGKYIWPTLPWLLTYLGLRLYCCVVINCQEWRDQASQPPERQGRRAHNWIYKQNCKMQWKRIYYISWVILIDLINQ